MSRSKAQAGASILNQSAAVWAVAFASVIAFMGIGLVDPILPAIATELKASAAQTELLFTSYLVVTGVAMFFTSWLASRIGAKRTLLIGLALIVVFALLAGLAPTVDAIIGFRAGWGLGNALFISTALATIVGAASGGTSAAIILYEAALGLGIAIGPLLGGLLGSWSWRGPFFGTAALMAIGFIVITVLLKQTGPRPEPTPISAPFRALRNRALGTLASAALFYNMGFFVLLAYSPFALVPLGVRDAIGLGLVFFGWGIALAIASVWLAPLLTNRIPRTHVLMLALGLFTLDLVAAALLIHSAVGLIVTIVIGGLIQGALNTVLTESVMTATELPRTVASSAYSGVRFLGGAVAPPAAAFLADAVGPTAPFLAGAIVVVIAGVIILARHGDLLHINRPHAADETEALAISLGDAD